MGKNELVDVTEFPVDVLFAKQFRNWISFPRPLEFGKIKLN